MADVVTGDAVCAAILATTVDLVNVAPFISGTLQQTSSTNVTSETLPETAVLAVGGLEEWAVMRAHQPGGALQQISKEPLHHSSERLELWAVWEQIWACSDRLQMRLLDAGTSLGCRRLLRLPLSILSAYYAFASEQTEKRKSEEGRLAAHGCLPSETRASPSPQQFPGETPACTCRCEQRGGVLTVHSAHQRGDFGEPQGTFNMEKTSMAESSSHHPLMFPICN